MICREIKEEKIQKIRFHFDGKGFIRNDDIHCQNAYLFCFIIIECNA